MGIDRKENISKEHQDQLDAATIYSMLENEIVPLYFAKNTKGYSPEWIQYIKNSISQITPRYTTKRMLDDYIEKFYTKLATRSKSVKADNFKKAVEISAWKEKIATGWDAITVESVEIPEKLIHNPEVAEEYKLKVAIDLHELNDKGIGVELVVTYVDENNKTMLHDVEELELVKSEGSKLFYELNYKLFRAGTFQYAFRMFPKNEDLPHRMDFCYVRWI